MMLWKDEQLYAESSQVAVPRVKLEIDVGVSMEMGLRDALDPGQ